MLVCLFLVFSTVHSLFFWCIAFGPLGLKGKRIGQILGIIFGTLVFTTYLTLFIWFTPRVRVRSDIQTIIYAAPIVLTILLSILTLLSQTSKKEEGENDEMQSEEPPPGEPAK